MTDATTEMAPYAFVRKETLEQQPPPLSVAGPLAWILSMAAARGSRPPAWNSAVAERSPTRIASAVSPLSMAWSRAVSHSPLLSNQALARACRPAICSGCSSRSLERRSCSRRGW